MNKLTSFGRDVKYSLLEKNLSHKFLAKELGITAPYLSQILYGVRPGGKHLSKIAAILGLDLTKYVA